MTFKKKSFTQKFVKFNNAFDKETNASHGIIFTFPSDDGGDESLYLFIPKSLVFDGQYINKWFLEEKIIPTFKQENEITIDLPSFYSDCDNAKNTELTFKAEQRKNAKAKPTSTTESTTSEA
ncbi:MULTISPECIES: hypothetical protein [Burkholderia]|uniref:hypothetical protein n=1 Tax=Burkholderia TaxID=32008 RepID=UPI00117DC40E|nr:MULTISPECIES: hypothetical protein [Burkholderia]